MTAQKSKPKQIEVILTRAMHQMEASVQLFKAEHLQVIQAPTIQFIEPPPADDALYARGTWFIPKTELEQRLWRFDWVIFTSTTAVSYADLAWQSIGGLKAALSFCKAADAHRARLRKIACIGKSTQSALEALGIQVDLVPQHYHAEALLEAFHHEPNLQFNQQRFLIPRALSARELLPNSLRALGAEVWITPLYQTVMCPLSEQQLELIFNQHSQHRALVFTSNSTMENFIKQLSVKQIKRLKRESEVFVIGPVVEKAAQIEGFNVVAVAEPHTLQGLKEALIKYYQLNLP